MSETSSGSDERIQCLSIALQRCVGDSERDVKQLANTLLNKEIIRKDNKIFDLVKKNDLKVALEQMTQHVLKAEKGFKELPSHLKESGVKNQVVSLVEKLVEDNPHLTFFKLVKRWDVLINQKETFKLKIQKFWPNVVEELIRNWPIRFLLFCAEDSAHARAKELLLQTDEGKSEQVMTESGSSDHGTRSLEDSTKGEESDQPESLDFENCNNSNTTSKTGNETQNRDFLTECCEEIEKSREILLPIVRLIWPGKPEITNEETWPDVLMSVASDEGFEQCLDHFIKACRYIFEKLKTSPNFKPQSYIDTGAAELWIQNLETYFNESKEQVEAVKLLLEISWPDIISIPAKMWKDQLVQKYQCDPSFATDFVNASNILLGMIEFENANKPSKSLSEDFNKNIAPEKSVNLTVIAGILSEKDEDHLNLSQFLVDNYDAVTESANLLLPIVNLILPEDSERRSADDESWLDDLMSIETDNENKVSHQLFRKICFCFLEFGKASPVFQSDPIAEPEEAWGWVEKYLQKPIKSEISMKMFDILLRLTWPNIDSIQQTWMEKLRTQYADDKDRFQDFAKSAKILLKSLQACETKNIGNGVNDQNLSPEVEFLKGKFEELTAVRDMLAPIAKVIWPTDTSMAETENWLNDLISDLSKTEDRLPGQHFVHVCQCILDLSKDSQGFQSPIIMDAKSARGWIMAVQKKIIQLGEEDMETVNIILQLAWPTNKKIDPTEWTKLFLRQYKLDIARATDIANAARTIICLIENAKQDSLNVQTLQEMEESSPELEFVNENYEAICDLELFLLPVVQLIWSADPIEYGEEGDWIDELLSRIVPAEDELFIDFIELTKHILDIKKKIPDMTLVQVPNIDTKDARAWVMNGPRHFKKTEKRTVLFNKLLHMGWSKTEKMQVQDWTTTLLQKHKSDTLKTTEFANAANVFLQIYKVNADIVTNDIEEAEFQKLATFLNENYESISSTREVLLPTMKFTWPGFGEQVLENWPDDAIATIFEHGNIDSFQPFMKICSWILTHTKEAKIFRVTREQGKDDKSLRKWILDNTKKFLDPELGIDLFNALLEIAWPMLGSTDKVGSREPCRQTAQQWKSAMFGKVRKNKDRVTELIYIANIVLDLTKLKVSSKTGIAEESEQPLEETTTMKQTDEGKTRKETSVEKAQACPTHTASRPRIETRLQKKQLKNAENEDTSNKQNYSSNVQETLPTFVTETYEAERRKGATTKKPSPDERRKSRADTVTNEPYARRNDGASLLSSRQGVLPARDCPSQTLFRSRSQTRMQTNRSKPDHYGIQDQVWPLEQSSASSEELRMRQNQVQSREIIIRVAASGVHSDEIVRIRIGKEWIAMDHLE
uniref:uncharacterized protein LOC120337152 n=1 Tax=Styela clava TaxID=7725 RepID=UPI00193954CB|nr:uncharacterized protein LOC120337152 [Styela clava]